MYIYIYIYVYKYMVFTTEGFFEDKCIHTCKSKNKCHSQTTPSSERIRVK